MLTDEKNFVERLKSLARLQNPEVIREELDAFQPADIAEGLERLELEEALSLLQQLPEELGADVLIELPTELTRRLVSELPDTTLALYLDILPMDDALELGQQLPDDRFHALLEVIPKEDALEIRRALTFAEETAGRQMTEDFFEVRPETSMRQIIRMIREADDEEYETVNDIYVLDENRHLLGVFSLRQAVRSPILSLAKDVMHPDVITCSADDQAEKVARQIAKYGFYAMPVLDERGRMLGIFTVDDAHDVLEEADTEDVLKMGGVSGDVDSYLSLSVFQLVWRRLPWLLILFVAETFTGAVLRHYVPQGAQGGTGELETIAKLMIFVPLLIGAGGNSGAQVTTTITRALAVGEVHAQDAFRILRRELLTSVLVGTTLGLTCFLRAYFGWHSGLDISLTVALALPAIVVWAAAVGSLLPLGAKRFGVDPAVMSAPFVTTFVDATGLVIYFEIARHTLGLSF